MVYVLATLVPPLGLLVVIVFCVIFGQIFHVLLLVPSVHAVIAVHMKRDERRHREVVEAIRRHGVPPGYPR
jgi:type IV secretory pathway VirB3-like protein